MSRLQWRWIANYLYSSLITVTLAGFVLILLIPELLETVPSSVWWKIGAAALTAAGATGLICGFRFSRNLRRRLSEAGVATRMLAYGHLDHRLPFTDDPEMGEIATAFNEMADRLEQQISASQRLADQNEQLVQQARTHAVSEERQRLARELHDAVSQQLFAISMTAASAARTIDRDHEKTRSLIDTIEQSSSRAQSEMRALLLQLRPSTLQEEDLQQAIRQLADELEQKQIVDFRVRCETQTLPPSVENHLYRIVQEAVSNILRHAEAATISLTLLEDTDKRRIAMTIEDDGIGFNETQVSRASYGMASIRERVGLLGGSVEWISYPGKGTRLEIRIPLTAGQSQEKGGVV